MPSSRDRREAEPRPRIGSPSGGNPFAGTGAGPWLVLGALALAAGLGAAVWAGGVLVAAATGRPRPPALSSKFYGDLLRGRTDSLFPDLPMPAVYATTAAMLLVLLAVAVWITVKVNGRMSRPGDPLPSLANTADLARLTGPGLVASGAQLRPSLAGRKPKTLTGPDLGVPLGTLMRSATQLRASWEDVLLAVMAPRSGKTTALAVPAVLDAPGAVVATSNKADLWLVTAGARADHGRVWTFDPQSITYAPRTWWWNPLAGVDGIEDAHRLAQHFLSAKAEEDFWDKAALELLTALILAAAVNDGTLADVFAWVTDSAANAPVRALDAAGYGPTARALRGAQGGAPETREGIYQTARTAAQALQDPRIMAWVTPPTPAEAASTPAFDAAAFAASRDTLYLLSKDGAGSAAPLVASLTDAVFRAATRVAERRGGRLDPPLIAVLDEAANICRIKDLPDLYSHLGSRGIIPITILQSARQGVRVWGEPGWETLWSAATVKLIGAGIDDARTADDLSKLVGDHDVPIRSTSVSRNGLTDSTSLRRQRILGPDEIRALPKGAALLFATGTRAALLHLDPWYTSPRAAALTAASATAQADLTARAQPAPPSPSGGVTAATPEPESTTRAAA